MDIFPFIAADHESHSIPNNVRLSGRTSTLSNERPQHCIFRRSALPVSDKIVRTPFITIAAVVERLAIVHKVDDVIEKPRQNQLRIWIADTDAEPRWR